VLLRISARTGAVLERWPMPQIVRALLAADAHSLWLAPSIQSGTPGGVTGSQLAPYISLYRITRGRRSPQRVFSVGGSGARWLVASGDDASAAIDNGRGKAAVWTFSANAAPVHGKPLNFLRVGTELGTGSPTVAGDPKTGFYNVLTSNGIEKVVHVQPSGRGQELVATIRAPNVTPADGFAAGVTFDGSFYFLDPPADARSGQVRLHRITPR
jgi:hypothetical protein